MPLKVEAGSVYGRMIGPSLAVSLGASETLPLLIPEDEPEQNYLKPLTRAELEAAAGGPGWKKFRSRLILLFWLSWLTILGIAITVIVQSPRPVAHRLPWWQKELFYRLQPALFMDAETSAISRVSERLPYLKSLGVGVIILEGLFRPDVSVLNLTQIEQRLGTLSEFHQFITNSHAAGMRVILDLCNYKAEIISNASDYVQDSLRYWLEQGVSGFEICNVGTAFTEKTLQKWKEVVKEFNTDGNERITMVREISDSVPGLNISESAINSSTFELVSKFLIPPSSHPLSASEIAEEMESMLKNLHGERPSWRVDGPVSWNLQKIVMVLMMTLPGTPVIRHGDEISQAPNPHHPTHSTALFHSLSRIRFHEEALLYGTFTFLTFNTTSLSFGSTNSTNSTATSPMAYLRSWGCVHFLVLFNLGSESHALNYNWTLSVPESGMFVTSTGLNRVGPVTLQSITLQPYEAIVIKLFETDPDFREAGNKYSYE
ncbi:4F2 cell-surface antigen heavy chain [Tachysurus fulvidraco]|uniref:4F2 cell-surface antigen heavy chain n=1 Tax=Tachysurus fulvidraco TaxID=1234273 RepID=UPI001FF018B5|nr:4F2 cell-surface antigen heavy chain [Tachysurus fulvidraco]